MAPNSTADYWWDRDAMPAQDEQAGKPGRLVNGLSPKANELIEEFGQAQGVTLLHVRRLKDLLIGSPALAIQFDTAAKKGVVRHIELLRGTEPGRQRIDGDGVLRLSPGVLSFGPESRASFLKSVGRFARTLQYGLDKGRLEKRLARSREKFTEVACSNRSTHDYTGAVRDYISNYRSYETRADIASRNAKVSADWEPRNAGKANFVVRALRTVRDYFRSCFGKATAYDHVAASNKNIASLAKYRFDSKQGYGYTRNSDLANYYGRYAVGYAAQCELHRQQLGGSRHRVRIDMAALGLSEDTVKENGVNLNGYADSIAYVDKSGGIREDSNLPHTMRLCQRDHPDHWRYGRLLACLKELDTGCSPRGLRNLAAALLADSREQGMIGIDTVYVEAGKAFVVLAPGTPRQIAAGGSIRERVGMSVEDSSRRWLAGVRSYDALRCAKAEQSSPPIQAPSQHLRGRAL